MALTMDITRNGKTILLTEEEIRRAWSLMEHKISLDQHAEYKEVIRDYVENKHPETCTFYKDLETDEARDAYLEFAADSMTDSRRNECDFDWSLENAVDEAEAEACDGAFDMEEERG